jgi:hypothetical protein
MLNQDQSININRSADPVDHFLPLLGGTGRGEIHLQQIDADKPA